MKPRRFLAVLAITATCASIPATASEQTVCVSRMWHDHQPIYWPDWNSNGSQTHRVQYAWDSIYLQNNGGNTYAGSSGSHPQTGGDSLSTIFSTDDRKASYQGRPHDSLSSLSSETGFCMSYTGSLLDNVRNLASNNQLGYGSGWNSGNTTARGWKTPAGSPRLDLVGFAYHHALCPLVPKSVLRKEIDIFKQAWWKAWGGNSDLSGQSKGFFPTEMAFSETIVDVLYDEGYQWVIVPSHHLSRTCPTYTNSNLAGNGASVGLTSPNQADQYGPSLTTGWWLGGMNNYNAFNVSPFAYQLHWVKYVNPETGQEKKMIAVPSDDVYSYALGFQPTNAQMIADHIAPYSTDSNHPALVLPATDGDNAWGGGYDSWMTATPAFINDAKSRGYAACAVQDLVNAHPPAANDVVHVEDGAWVFPSDDNGSPYFLKWVEPPIKANSANNYPNTKADFETPGFSEKFYNWAQLMTGANWCETAEQMWTDQNGTNSVQAWKIQAPYDWDNSDTNPNIVELAWHIYLAGYDSGFNYYGGIGANDDEVKAGLTTLRAIDTLRSYVSGNLANDRTPPTIFRPQRFPWNPGGYTLGWFNNISSSPQKMNSEFYVWTHVYDVSGVQSVNLKVRASNTGVNSTTSNDNQTYAGGSNVGAWVTIPMNKKALPNTVPDVTAAANNSSLNYFILPDVLADYYYVKISNINFPSFRNKLLDYYIEATDNRGNLAKTDIQHVFVQDDGASPNPPAKPVGLTATAVSNTSIALTWNSATDATSYLILRSGTQIGTSTTAGYNDNGLSSSTPYTYTLIAQNSGGNSPSSDPASATTLPPPTVPAVPTGLTATPASNTQINLSWAPVSGATSYILKRNGTPVGYPSSNSYNDTGLASLTTYTYTVAASNSAGPSADSQPVSATTLAAPVDFIMDGIADSAGYLVSNPGMTIYAALRGTKLYVATWTPSGGVNDHFIFVSDALLSGTAPVPWAKAGSVAVASTKPYLAAESTNSYAGWLNAPTGSQVFRSGTAGQQLEGVIDLAAAFGSVPPVIYIASAAYQTDDKSATDPTKGVLAAQAPASLDGDGNIDANEFLALPTDAIRDSAASGVFDRLDPARSFRVYNFAPVADGYSVTWKVVPGHVYTVEYTNTLGGAWQPVGGASGVVAGSGQDTMTATDSGAGSATHRFYRVRLVQ